jgi:hypothetical protein
MASPVQLYQQEMHNNLGFFATWLPSATIQIGDIGVFDSGRFRRVASLNELGIAQPELREGTPEDVSYSAAVNRKVGVDASAGISALGKGELSLAFTREGGYVFEAIALTQVEIADRLSMSASVLQAFSDGRWQKDWMLVDALYRAKSATILVSQDASSHIVLKANGPMLPTGIIPLADPKLGLSISSTSGRIVHVIAANTLHPLYSCLNVHDPLFGKPAMAAVRSRSTVQQGEPLARPQIDALLHS